MIRQIWWFLILFLIWPKVALSQLAGNATIVVFPGTPSGSCNSRQLALIDGNGSLYTCVAAGGTNQGFWQIVAGGPGGGGWNPPTNTPGNTLFGNNSVGTGSPSFFIPGGDVSFSAGSFSVNSLHFGPNNLALTNTGIATGNCLQVFGSEIIGGACGTGGGSGGSGTVTSFSAGSLSPLFTTSVATATTTPALTFTLSAAPANTVLGNNTAASAAPSWIPLTTGGGGLSGSGTVNYLSKFTSATALGNSLLTDNGTTLTYTGSGGITASQFNSSGSGPFKLTSITGTLPALPGAGQNALVSGTDGWYVSNNNGAYFKIEPAGTGGTGGAVASVFGRTGAVVAANNDYSVSQVQGAAPLASPTFTGVPLAPTAPAGTNTQQIATTAFVLANQGSAPGGGITGSGTNGVLPIWTSSSSLANSLLTDNGTALTYAGLGGIVSSSGITTTGLTASNPTAGVTAPQPPANDSSNKIATTAWVKATISGGGGGTGPAVPIGPSQQSPVCYGTTGANTDTTHTFNGLNIQAGDTVMVSIMNGNGGIASGPGLDITSTITDSGGSVYSLRHSRISTAVNSSKTSIYSTQPSAALQSSTLTITNSAPAKFVACVAAFVGVASFGTTAEFVNPGGLLATATVSLPLQDDAGYLFAAFASSANVTVPNVTVGTPGAGGGSSTGAGLISAVTCTNTDPTAGTVVACTIAPTVNAQMTGVGVELRPGATGPPAPSFVGPKVVAYRKASVGATNVTAFLTCSMTDCPAGFYRANYNFLAITGCTAGTLQVMINYIDESSPTARYIGMMDTPAQFSGTNMVFGYRTFTLAGTALSGSVALQFNTSTVACSSGTGAANLVISVERLQ